MSRIGILPDGAMELSCELVKLKYAAFTMGLIKTGHALDKATNAIGWEMAEILEGKRVDHFGETGGQDDIGREKGISK